MQTVPVSQVTQMAKALPKPQIEKGKVWAVFIGGAASLFIVTVAAENNKSWFPAIARANAAMAVARKRAEVGGVLSAGRVDGIKMPVVAGEASGCHGHKSGTLAIGGCFHSYNAVWGLH